MDEILYAAKTGVNSCQTRCGVADSCLMLPVGDAGAVSCGGFCAADGEVVVDSDPELF